MRKIDIPNKEQDNVFSHPLLALSSRESKSDTKNKVLQHVALRCLNTLLASLIDLLLLLLRVVSGCRRFGDSAANGRKKRAFRLSCM